MYDDTFFVTPWAYALVSGSVTVEVNPGIDIAAFECDADIVFFLHRGCPPGESGCKFAVRSLIT